MDTQSLLHTLDGIQEASLRSLVDTSIQLVYLLQYTDCLAHMVKVGTHLLVCEQLLQKIHQNVLNQLPTYE